MRHDQRQLESFRDELMRLRLRSGPEVVNRHILSNEVSMPRISTLMLLVMLGSAGTAEAQLKATATDLARLGWMAGCWTGTSGGLISEEQRMPLRAGSMVGVGREIRGDRLTSAELTIVRLRADSLVYEAFPTGQAAAVFVATMVTDSSVTFANPAHDFPQRIMYRRVGADSLLARIEGERNGQVRGFDYPMRRVACAGE